MTLTEAGAKEAVGNAAGPMLPIEQEAARGLRFAHIVISAIQQQGWETAHFIEALNQRLAAKGIIGDASRAHASEAQAQTPAPPAPTDQIPCS